MPNPQYISDYLMPDHRSLIPDAWLLKLDAPRPMAEPRFLILDAQCLTPGFPMLGPRCPILGQPNAFPKARCLTFDPRCLLPNSRPDFRFPMSDSRCLLLDALEEKARPRKKTIDKKKTRPGKKILVRKIIHR